MSDILYDRPFVNRMGIRPVPTKTIREIQREVAAKYGLTHAELVGPQKSRRVSWPRQEAYWLCAKLVGASLPLIAREFGGRDHTTVQYGIGAHEQRMGAQIGA